MIKIKQVKILRYRSINDLTLKIDTNNNIISICGQNNVGKTNILRAIELFFRPEKYDYKLDVPSFKQANEFGGGSVYTVINIIFEDENGIQYDFTRDFKLYITDKDSLIKCSQYKDGKKEKLDCKQASAILSKIKLYYIESIESIVSDTINKIADDVLDIKYEKARFSESRKKLKDSYDEYIVGMQNILNAFADQISNTFTDFNENWSVKFNIPKSSNNFKELITKDAVFDLFDSNANGIINKGAGLQRLALILLQFEVIKREGRQSKIVLIDEPELYIHEGLQRKLKTFFDKMTDVMQIFYTTHSKVFINTYNAENIFLIKSICEKKSVKGKEKDFFFSNLVNIEKENGNAEICEHLGIEQSIAEPLKKYNILVEGESDIQYLSELAKYFGLDNINMISANGANNIEKLLDFYNSYYKNYKGIKPKVKVVFDNDFKGRECYKKINPQKYAYLEVEKLLLNNCFGDANLELSSNRTNNEIEDFVYPEIICYLANRILRAKGLITIREKDLITKISSPAFKSGGILALLEHLKNEKNPVSGKDITFSSSDLECETIKKSMSNLFKIEMNKEIIKLLKSVVGKHPNVETQLRKMFKFS